MATPYCSCVATAGLSRADERAYGADGDVRQLLVGEVKCAPRRGDGALRVACCMRDDSPGAVAQGDGALGAPITTNAAAICGGQRLQRWRDRSHRERTPTVAVRRADVGARRPHGGIHWPLALVLQRILVAVRCARDHGRSDQRSSGSGHLRERLEGESIWPRRRCRALCPASLWRRTTATMMSRGHGVASRRASTEGGRRCPTTARRRQVRTTTRTGDALRVATA